MKKIRKLFKDKLRAKQVRDERRARRSTGQAAFGTYQISHIAKFDQRLIVMGR